jgi:hypothetical protein
MRPKWQTKEPKMRNKPKVMPKMAQKTKKYVPKASPSGKKSPGVTYVYRKDAFNKVKIA